MASFTVVAPTEAEAEALRREADETLANIARDRMSQVGPVIFQSCGPCDDGSCGTVGCDHQSHDQEEFATADEAVALMHKGCFCTLISKDHAP